MAKIRVYELATRMGLDNKDMVEKLQEAGIEVKGHMSSIEEDVAHKFEATMSGKSEESPAEEPPVQVKEERISTGLIRRRRKAVSKEAAPATEEEVVIQPPTVVYTERIVRNKQYNANIPAVIFQSTTGLNVSGDGVLQGTDLTVAELLVFLQVSGALAEFAATTPTGFDDTVGDTIEKVVTI